MKVPSRTGPKPPESLPPSHMLPEGHPLRVILELLEYQKRAGRVELEDQDRLGLDGVG